MRDHEGFDDDDGAVLSDVRETVRKVAFQSVDPDETHRYIEQVLPHRRLWMSGARERFAFASRSAIADGLSAHAVRYSTSVQCVAEPVTSFVALRITAGSMTLESMGNKIHLEQSSLAVLPMGDPLRATWSDLEMEIVVLPWHSIVEAARTVGNTPPGEVKMLGQTPVDESMARHWHHTLRFVHRELFAPRSALGTEPLHTSFTRTAAVTALLTFPNTALERDQHRRLPGAAGPAALRRALAFMDANARGPITVSDVAADSGVSVRALEMAFRRYYGSTPTGHLRAVRLAGAHRELREADPTSGVTVSDIAANWGYHSHSAFTAAYRRQFGKSPRQTLSQ